MTATHKLNYIDFRTIDTANRKHQNWTVNTILKNWETHQFVACEAPTGVGKSIIGMVAQYLQSINWTPDANEENLRQTPRPAKVMTTTKALQRQYITDFDVHHLFGAKNYTCPTGDAEYYKGRGCLKKRCGSRHICPYLVEREIAMNETSIINYAQAFSLPQIAESASVLVFDEAHDFETTVLETMSVEITEAMCNSANTTAPVWDDIESVRAAAKRIYDYAIKLPEDDEDREDMITAYGAAYAEDRLWIPSKKSAKFKPPFLTREMLNPLIGDKKVLFLTATLGSFSQFCKNCGISSEEAKFIKVPEVFDPERTPEIWKFNVGSLNAGNLVEKTPDMADSIRQILEIHEGQRGLIHVPSYKLAEDLVKLVKSDRLVITNGNEYKQYDDIEDAVLVSPSLHTGVSFNDDQARFNVIAKTSWLYLGDPFVAFRKGHDNNWYVNEARKKLHQQKGRTTRSAEDWSTIYYLDLALKRLL